MDINSAPQVFDGTDGTVTVGAITLSSRKPQALFKALVEMRKTLLPVAKSAENPAFKREGKAMRYATLGDIDEALRKPLENGGIAVLGGAETDNGNVYVTTMIGHAETGEWAATTLSAKPRGTDPQGIGSAVTYLRRYGIGTLIEIVTDDDDDGNAASLPQSRRDEPRREPAQRTEQQKAEALRAALKGTKSQEMALDLFEAAWRDWLADAPRATQDYFIDAIKSEYGVDPLDIGG